MTSLFKNLAAQLPAQKLQFHSPHIWIYHNKEDDVIVKIEKNVHPSRFLVNASYARDSGAALSANFLSVLLLEDSHACCVNDVSVSSGLASVTIFHFLELSDMTTQTLHDYLKNFCIIVLWIRQTGCFEDALMPVSDRRQLEL
ncbi:MAG: hypothetical protein ACON4G_06475 [Candidatus Puniceispirillaceae bacterium]